MNKLIFLMAGLGLLLGASNAEAGGKRADIVVMTQNQYLGADLEPVIAADATEYPAAVAAALQAIAINNTPERTRVLARQIAINRPHLVALQEVYWFGCTSLVPNACAAFDGAFNDHLDLTTSALGEFGADYDVVAVQQNMTIPALPVFLPNVVDGDGNPTPAMVISVIDRDVILARGDVDATPAALPCSRAGGFSVGCNFEFVAPVETPLGTIVVERGFVGANATVNGDEYLFVNTHLETKMLGGIQATTALQPAQAAELNATLAGYLGVLPVPPKLILAGDINSGPDAVPLAPDYFPPAYHQFASWLTDVWNLNQIQTDGFTCCQAADLLNYPSSHDERIDVIFTLPAPTKSLAYTVGDRWWSRTQSGLWPSDHASVVARMRYD